MVNKRLIMFTYSKNQESIRIIRILLITVILLTATFVVSANRSESLALNKVCKVTASSLTARSNAGTKYSKIGTISKGTYKIVQGSKKDTSGTTWYKVSVGKKNGYICSKYVNIISLSVTKMSNTKGKVNVSSGTLIARSGPGKVFSNIGSVAKGKTITITGKVKGYDSKYWYQFTFNKKTAYVCSSYIKLTSTSSSTTSKSNSSSTTKATTTKSSSSSTSKTYKIGTVSTSSSSLNVRSGAGTSYSKLGTIAKGTVITITGSAKDSSGTTWYKYAYTSSKNGYISSKYLTVKTVSSDSSFESYMTSQGFPNSYKAGLRILHAIHPNWTFRAYKTNTSWSTALNAETKNVGTNLVSKSLPTSYRSKASKSYNSKTKVWTKFDGSWYAANKTVVAYYMDPRNFLNENGIYQFMTHQYHSGSQNSTTVKAVIKGSFMATRSTGDKKYTSFATLINAAGKAASVNPNVIAAMILQEQGSKGSSRLISGTCSGYKGYYNFFNIGAYTTSKMSAVTRGLWYAKQSGSYGRPWNSVYKSIYGGALFYSKNYTKTKQDTYYYKKFNVKNGTSKIGTHQYMTNVSAAASEGKLLKSAFSSNSSYSAVIEIPIYTSMPTGACPLP